MALGLHVTVERYPLRAPFRIAGYCFETAEVVRVEVEQFGLRGRGEASGVYYLDDRPEGILQTLESRRDVIQAGITRGELQQLLPPGGARNALDCALWDLEAKVVGLPAWSIAGLSDVRPLRTTFTVGAGEPAEMAAGALAHSQARSLKLKLTGDLDLDLARLSAVRSVRPDAWIGVDGNQGFDRPTLERLLPGLVDAKVSLLEQPLPRGKDADLDGIESPIPIAADESALCLEDLDRIVGAFDVVNIKLDKCGGLTEALAMVERARELGLGVMVGCMNGSSLAMAPAFVVGQLCDLVDLDGPTFLKRDSVPSVTYADGMVWSPANVWGNGDAGTY